MDLINRVLDKGVVISAHITISVANIDLVALDAGTELTVQGAIGREAFIERVWEWRRIHGGTIIEQLAGLFEVDG